MRTSTRSSAARDSQYITESAAERTLVQRSHWRAVDGADKHRGQAVAPAGSRKAHPADMLKQRLSRMSSERRRPRVAEDERQVRPRKAKPARGSCLHGRGNPSAATMRISRLYVSRFVEGQAQPHSVSFLRGETESQSQGRAEPRRDAGPAPFS